MVGLSICVKINPYCFIDHHDRRVKDFYYRRKRSGRSLEHLRPPVLCHTVRLLQLAFIVWDFLNGYQLGSGLWDTTLL
ncbi:hypothetical protein Nepgr_019381 [Nepenthes gracilis]|uniref:Uncharacterized protein n=1 Tax=Nepenthes gracilis TaxID=150966 RepID=A0AAD3STG0_NEPGR|nr:hypothetical protein Nepgr_019381 [Nepenthes gracilis]